VILLFVSSLQLFDILLAIAAIIGVTAMLRIFFKKRIIAFLIAAILVIGTAYMIDRSHYTTFTEVYSDHLNEESIVRSITIYTNYIPDDYTFDREAYIEIEDKEIMNELIQEFSQLELKRDRDHHVIENPSYRVRITTTNEEEAGLLRTESFYFELDEEYLDRYEVINDTNHLQILDRLVENEKMENE